MRTTTSSCLTALAGAVVATLVSTIAFVVVVFQDPHFVEFMLRQAGGA